MENGYLDEDMRIDSSKRRTKEKILNEDQIRYLNNDIRPFYGACIVSFIGGGFQVAIVAYAFAFDPLFYDLGVQFIGGLDSKQLPTWTFFCLLPLLFGVFQISISVIGSLFARMERSLKEASVIDVLLHMLPSGRVKEGFSYLPLHCTSRLLFLRILIVFSFLITVGSAIMYSLIADVNKKVGTGADTVFSVESIRDLLDYSGAIFNECCAASGESNQGMVIECLPDDTNPSCQYPFAFSSKTIQTCGCYKYGTREKFQQRLNYVRKSTMCSLMQQAIITIGENDNIPGSALSIRLIIPKQIKSIPIVGEKEFYGCGGGYAKAMQYALSQWIVRTLEFYVISVLIANAVQLGILLGSYLLTCTTDKPEMSEEEAEIRLRIQRGVSPTSSSFGIMKAKSAVGFMIKSMESINRGVQKESSSSPLPPERDDTQLLSIVNLNENNTKEISQQEIISLNNAQTPINTSQGDSPQSRSLDEEP